MVAIIAILAGMLMPALNKARDTARSAGCMSNLSQLGKAISTYQSASDDYNPYSRYDHAAKDDASFRPKKEGWQAVLLRNGYLGSGADLSSLKAADTGTPDASTLKVNILLCPSADINKCSVSGNIYNGYVANGSGRTTQNGFPRLFGLKISVNNPPVKAGRIRKPSAVAAFFDGREYDSGSRTQCQFISGSSGFTGDLTTLPDVESKIFKARHNVGVNMVFMDGHSATKKIMGELPIKLGTSAPPAFGDTWEPLGRDYLP